MSGLASMCIMFKCQILLYVELNEVHMCSYGIDKGLTILNYELTDRLGCNGNRK